MTESPMSVIGSIIIPVLAGMALVLAGFRWRTQAINERRSTTRYSLVVVGGMLLTFSSIAIAVAMVQSIHKL